MKKLDPIRVLLVNVGGPGAPGTIRSLRAQAEREIMLVGIDINPHVPTRALLDVFEVSPRSDDVTFLSFIRDICKREKIDVILPLSSLGIELFEKIAKEPEMPAVIITSVFTLNHTLNKRKFFEFLQEIGLTQFVPNYRSVTNSKDFLLATKELGFPEVAVCFKPEEGKGGRGFRVLTENTFSLSDMLGAKDSGSGGVVLQTLFAKDDSEEFPPTLVMEYLPRKEYSVDVLAKEGKVLVAVPRSRETVISGIVSGGIVEKEPVLQKAATQIVEALKGNYLLNVQFRYDRTGVPKILEVNPRISGTIAHVTCAGVNLPYFAVKQALGEEFHIPEPVWGTRLARGFYEAYSDSKGIWKIL